MTRSFKKKKTFLAILKRFVRLFGAIFQANNDNYYGFSTFSRLFFGIYLLFFLKPPTTLDSLTLSRFEIIKYTKNNLQQI